LSWDQADGPLELKEIEDTFVNYAPIWHLHVGGEVIRTTDEHPFWIVGKGWTKASELRIGDLLVSHDGQTAPVDDILDTGIWETVYNFRVADCHTYFVGSDEWCFSVWAHNSCTVSPRQLARAQAGAQELVNSGVPGAQRLLNLLNSNAVNKSGYVFQVRRAHYYQRHGQLRAVEARVSPNNERRVDMRLTDGLRVEAKSWRNFDYFSQPRQDGMLNGLRDQVGAYLQTPGSRLRIEFDKVIPDRVQQALDALKLEFGDRLTWTIIR
jgi:intein/homing endonuclease